MKKSITAFIIAFILLITNVICMAEENSIKDATYEYLFANLLDVISTDGSNNTLKLQNATVWRVNDTLAGFMFEGDDWQITGEAITETGVIYKINARLPYNVAGIFATRMIAYTLSEVSTWDVFTSTYTDENTILNTTPMNHYVNTLNSGNSSTMIFEFTRIVSLDLNDNTNAFNMVNTIKTMQDVK
jgi:hypothetical protein